MTEFQSTVANCHCQMCRKHTGSAYATYAGVRSEYFRWLSGQERLTAFVAPNGTTRKFCKECGSSLVFSSSREDEDIVEVALATLDGESPVKPNAHIFVAYKADWLTLDDELLQYPESRTSSPEGDPGT